MPILLTYDLWGCSHEYPDDWDFGGATGLDPRADPRWLPTTYQYLGRNLVPLATTQTPLCDHQALFERERVETRFGARLIVPFITAARPPNGELEMIYKDLGAVINDSAS